MPLLYLNEHFMSNPFSMSCLRLCQTELKNDDFFDAWNLKFWDFAVTFPKIDKLFNEPKFG